MTLSDLISAAAEAEEAFGADELERYAASLPAYRVYLSDGTSYVTSMARGVTLDQARAYFVGQPQEQADERTVLAVVRVEYA